MPVTVPILLKIDMKMKTNTHIAMSVVKISSVPTNLKAVGIKEGGKLTIFSGKDVIPVTIATTVLPIIVIKKEPFILK